MKVAVPGTGDVGRALGLGFLSRGHEVRMGSRDARNEKALAFAKEGGSIRARVRRRLHSRAPGANLPCRGTPARNPPRPAHAWPSRGQRGVLSSGAQFRFPPRCGGAWGIRIAARSRR